MNGILLVDKPRGKTSHDIVDEIRREHDERRVGHAGTLDPLATGLLVVALGKGLKLLEYLHVHDKTYEFEAKLGILTDTDDAEGKPIGEGPVPSREELEKETATFVGEIQQRPPRYSAVKVAGRKLYDYARSGEEVDAPVRTVTVHELTLLSYEDSIARFRLHGSKGIYVRAIARDLGGHVTALRRMSVGPFNVEDTGPDMLPIDTAVMHLPEMRLSTEEAHQFESGRSVDRPAPPLVRVYCGPRFMGIGRGEGTVMRPRKVIQL